MGTAFQKRMALVPATQAFYPFVVHLYGGTSVRIADDSASPESLVDQSLLSEQAGLISTHPQPIKQINSDRVLFSVIQFSVPW